MKRGIVFKQLRCSDKQSLDNRGWIVNSTKTQGYSIDRRNVPHVRRGGASPGLPGYCWPWWLSGACTAVPLAGRHSGRSPSPQTCAACLRDDPCELKLCSRVGNKRWCTTPTRHTYQCWWALGMLRANLLPLSASFPQTVWTQGLHIDNAWH